LKQPHQDEHHRGHHPNLLIGGKSSDQKGRYCHQRYRCGERHFAADLIADLPKEETSQRAHQKACRKDAKRRYQRGDPVLRRKEVVPDIRCKIAVDAEIVPLHHVAGDTGNNDASVPCQSFRVHPQISAASRKGWPCQQPRRAILPEPPGWRLSSGSSLRGHIHIWLIQLGPNCRRAIRR